MVAQGSCDEWNSFLISSTSVIDLINKVPVSISFSSFDSQSTRNYFCANSTVVSRILSSLSSKTFYSAHCNDSIWTVSRLSSSVSISVNESTGNVRSSLSPCQSAGRGIYSNLAKYLTISYQYKSSAPFISSYETWSQINSISINATFSDIGSTCCMAFLEGGVPASSNDVMLNGYCSLVDLSGTMLYLRELQPDSLYDVFCVSRSLSGSITSYQDMLSQRIRNIPTLCCKTIQVSIISQVLSLQSFERSVVVSSNSLPQNETIFLSLMGLDASSNSVLSSSDFYPNSIAMSPNTTKFLSSGVEFYVNARICGHFKLSLRFGTNSSHFDVVFPYGDSINISCPSSVVQSPSISAAVFSSSGGSIIVSFTQNTNRAGLSSTFPCSKLFFCQSCPTSNCVWSDDKTVYLTPTRKSSLLLPGDTISLKSGFVCPKSSKNCTFVSSILSTNITIARPQVPVAPMVVVSGPSYSSVCSDFILDYSSSTGSCGHAWANVSFKVSSSGYNASSLEKFMNSQTSSVITIPRMYLFPNDNLQFSLLLCNIFDVCNKGVYHVTILTSPAPLVIIKGPILRSMIKSDQLSLSAYNYFPCQNTTELNVTLIWQVFWNNKRILSLSSKSKEQDKFVLAPYSLMSNRSYEVRLSANYLSLAVSSKASVFVTVNPSSIHTVISFGSHQTINANSFLVLDGSSSYDDDTSTIPLGSKYSFSWSCIVLLPTFSPNCRDFVSSVRLNDMKLSLYGEQTSGNSQWEVSLSVSDGLRSSASSVVVSINPASSPIITFTNSTSTKLNPTLRNVLASQVYVSTSSILRWSCVGYSMNQTNIISPFKWHSIYLSISPFALPANTMLVFTLTATSLNTSLASLSSTVSLSLYVNGPPISGQLLVSCGASSSCVEFQDIVSFSSPFWVDTDLPLSYSFYYTQSTSSIILKSKSELSYGTAYLPAGRVESNYSIAIVVVVYDSLESSSNLTSFVSVMPKPSVNPLLLIQTFTSPDHTLDLLSSSIQQVSIFSTVLNRVDCTRSPNCSSLNRFPCSRTMNTCGACMKSYSGSFGDSNLPCYLPSRRKLTATLDCNSTKECSPWQECVNYRCTDLNKTCSNNCSYHGTCVFFAANSVQVSHCSLNNDSCYPFCMCSLNFSGVSCEYDITLAQSRQSSQKYLLNRLKYITMFQDPLYLNLLSWSSLLSAVVLSYWDLVFDSLYLSIDIFQNIDGEVSQFSSQFDFTALLNSIDSLGSSFILRSLVYEDSQYQSNIQQFGNVYESLIRSVLTSSLSSLLPGQEYSSDSFLNFQFSNKRISAASGEYVSIVVKRQSITESAINFVPLGSISDDYLSVISLSPLIFLSSKFSVPLVVIPPSRCSRIDCALSISLSNSVVGSTLAQISSIAKNWTCHENIVANNSISCPGFSYSYGICNGTEGIVSSYCPSLNTTLSCGFIANFTDSQISSCDLVGFSSNAVSCKCSLLQRSDNIYRFSSAKEYHVSYYESNFVVKHFETLTYNKSSTPFVVFSSVFFAAIVIFVGVYYENSTKSVKPLQKLSTKGLQKISPARNAQKSAMVKSIEIFNDITPRIFSYQRNFLELISFELFVNNRWTRLFAHFFNRKVFDKWCSIKLLSRILFIVFAVYCTIDILEPRPLVCDNIHNELECGKVTFQLIHSRYCQWNSIQYSCSRVQIGDRPVILIYYIMLGFLSLVIFGPLLYWLEYIVENFLIPPVTLVDCERDSLESLTKKYESNVDVIYDEKKYQELFGTVQRSDKEISDISSRLIEDIFAYREVISDDEKLLFDASWNINFSASESQKRLDVDTKPSVLHVLNAFDNESMIWKNSDNVMNTKRLLMLFICDLLSSNAKQVMLSKCYRDRILHRGPVQPSTKLWMFVGVMIFVFIALTYIYNSSSQTPSIEALICILSYLVFDVLLISNAEAFFFDIYVPFSIWMDVMEARATFLRTCIQFNKSILWNNRYGDFFLEGNVVKDPLKFNSFSYLSTSWKLAFEHRSMKECQIVVSYRTQSPPKCLSRQIEMSRYGYDVSISSFFHSLLAKISLYCPWLVEYLLVVFLFLSVYVISVILFQTNGPLSIAVALLISLVSLALLSLSFFLLYHQIRRHFNSIQCQECDDTIEGQSEPWVEGDHVVSTKKLNRRASIMELENRPESKSAQGSTFARKRGNIAPKSAAIKEKVPSVNLSKDSNAHIRPIRRFRSTRKEPKTPTSFRPRVLGPKVVDVDELLSWKRSNHDNEIVHSFVDDLVKTRLNPLSSFPSVEEATTSHVDITPSQIIKKKSPKKNNEEKSPSNMPVNSDDDNSDFDFYISDSDDSIPDQSIRSPKKSYRLDDTLTMDIGDISKLFEGKYDADIETMGEYPHRKSVSFNMSDLQENCEISLSSVNDYIDRQQLWMNFLLDGDDDAIPKDHDRFVGHDHDNGSDDLDAPIDLDFNI